MMVVVAFVQDNTNKTVLSGGFGVLNGLKEEVVENAHFVKDVIEEPVLDFNVGHLLNVYDKTINYLEFLS